MDDPYRALRQQLVKDGFYVTATESMGQWQRITICSQGPPKFRRFNGRSFWFAIVGGTAYVGAWGSYLYELPDDSKLPKLCRDFFAAEYSMSDFGAELKSDYSLNPIDNDVALALLPDERPPEWSD